MKLGEFELISLLSKTLKNKRNGIKVGIGDDTAVFELNGTLGLLTCDALVEGVHFLRNWKSLTPDFFYYLGRKLVSISVSDVASMGGAPLYSLITLGIPDWMEVEELKELYEGVNSALEEYDFSLIGGDTVKSPNFFLDLSLLGTSNKNRVMLRSKAKPGDLVGVTGTLGDSRAGLEQLLRGKVEDTYLVERFLNPEARLKEGVKALEIGVLCSTDVSDGFVFNLYTIAESSKVRIDLNSSEIPVSENLEKFAGDGALQYALYGGEDYELIITFPEEKKEKLENLGFKTVGTVSEGEGVFLDDKFLEKKGYDHFKGGV
ncbi:thiamine-monophosphate kinase [Balnearium lithotrophicum]|uniref:Thiamine-monophosphate kinase n=1 Tax=Balnearium lithotrophicum TaxID=223788 RepID=A0A521CYY9_9BACT|nr:thiamine-phosphate kinase [Balnearium lithotrophicum]SMO64622.1 thiamine-monophosphate kinase [Balnearium lithotrophicum]